MPYLAPKVETDSGEGEVADRGSHTTPYRDRGSCVTHRQLELNRSHGHFLTSSLLYFIAPWLVVRGGVECRSCARYRVPLLCPLILVFNQQQSFKGVLVPRVVVPAPLLGACPGWRIH